MDINWYPGHMVKTRRLVLENIKLVDGVVELVDARVPECSRNPVLGRLLSGKPLVLALNKADLAGEAETRAWLNYFSSRGQAAVAMDSLTGKGIDALLREAKATAVRTGKATVAHRIQRPTRLMVVGIPNVGKSSLINRMVRQSAAKTGNKPGVTRGKQWIRLRQDLEVLDMPGILWPKLAGEGVGFKLAVVGAIGEAAYNTEELALELLRWLQENAPGSLEKRFEISSIPEEATVVLEVIGRRRGILRAGGTVDALNTAKLLLKEFREGKLGRFTLDPPPGRS
ncbi:MAG: ribosome biogenesis GTPase YlqF [Bacillota bacterium]